MKKLVYLCGMMLLSMNMVAQINGDSNWREFFIEEFEESPSYWIWDTNNFSNIHYYNWKAYIGSRVDSDSLCHIYQYKNAQHDPINGYMKLVSNYDSEGKIQRKKFNLPTNGSSYGSIYYPNKHYFSGAIEYVYNIWDTTGLGRFKYGYFEIRCKLPTHKGAFPAFWLHGASTNSSDPYYEEIDIFEYSWALGSPSADWLPIPNPNPTFPGDPRVITTGIYHNLHGQGYSFDTDTYARNYPRLSNNQGDLSDWHIYSCEWMPDHVYWYLDGQLVNSFVDPLHIPRHPMYLKTNYAIDNYCMHNGSIWMGSGYLTIDYIKVYQLNCDCSTDEVITCQNDLNSFIVHPSVKNSISIAPISGTITVGNTDKVTFRVADTFEITGPFQADYGCEFTVIRQDCPE